MENIISNRLAVFPLPVYLLPGGLTKLRIFEPRYMRMVKEAGEDGFALSVYNPNLTSQTSPWAAKVDILDFDTLPDGLLGIVIKAQHLVQLTDIQFAEDELRSAKVETIAHWPEQQENNVDALLSAKLADLMQQNQSFAELYQTPIYQAEPQWQSATWVARRWLEVLPISYTCRQQFTKPASLGAAQQFIRTMLTGG